MSDEQLPTNRCIIGRPVADNEQEWDRSINVCYWTDKPCEEIRCKFCITICGNPKIIKLYEEEEETD